ncbi:hypothetical protein GOV06_03370 [Candidatus Woesearchaeota archaeon]|nr:hypothetical protein [Candidatus Woesearchaeota archaeon]
MTINKGKTNEELVNRYKARLKARKEKPVEPLEKRLTQGGENGLVYAVENKIFLYVNGNEDLLIKKRPGIVKALCPHKGELYDGGRYSARNTLSDATITKYFLIDYNTLCSHNGELYSAPLKGIYKISTDEKIAERQDIVLALCSHDGNLLDAAGRTVYHTLTNKEERKLDEVIYSLCSHDGDLYYAPGRKVCKVSFRPSMFGPENTESEITERPDNVLALCSHNEVLYDSGKYGLFTTHSDVPIIPSKDIGAMCSIPPELVKKILEERSQQTQLINPNDGMFTGEDDDYNIPKK